ncbi:hypothetical protein AAVH_32586 [Aphelenchoides avenae]|nr:hypothetical protein AAVH_32586 [Aphelenchus avenae]
MNDAPPQLHRQSPPKAPSPKKRRRLNDSPSSKRKRSMPPVEINVPNMASPEVEIDVVNCSRTNSFSVPPTSMGQNSSQKLDSLKALLDASSTEGPSKSSAASPAVNALKPPARTIDPNSPHRHHPDNLYLTGSVWLPKRNPEAALLEDFATVYMLNGFSDVNRQELQKTLENALRELRTEDSSQSSTAAGSGKPEDSAYSSSVSSRAASSSNPPETETPANGASATDGPKAGEKKENGSNNSDSSTW